MGRLPATHRERIQEAVGRYRRLEVLQRRHLYREVVAKLAIVIGPLIAFGSFFTESVGPVGALAALVAAAAGVLYQLETRVTEPRRLGEQERIADALGRIGVKLSRDGRKAASLDARGHRGPYHDPFDGRSYE